MYCQHLYIHEVKLSLSEFACLPSVQSEAPFTTLLVIAPPIGHTDDLATTEEQEHQEQVKVIARIEGRSHEIVVSRPQLASIPERPIHNHKATNKGRGIASTDITIEIRHTTEENGSVPKTELQLAVRELLVESKQQDRYQSTDEESIRQRLEGGLLEHLCGADDNVFDGC